MKRWESQRPSRELEEMLLAITLRISKDRFKRRQWENSQEPDGMEGKAKNGTDTDLGSDGVNEVEAGMVDEELPEEMSQVAQPEALEDIVPGTGKSIESFSQTSHEADGRSGHNSVLIEDPEPRSDITYDFNHPTVSADDERSIMLLRPTIRHTLSRLDELLMALHHARQTCLHYASEYTESQTDPEGSNASSDDIRKSDYAHPPPSTAKQGAKRSRPGRPPKIVLMPAHSGIDALESSQPRKKKDTRGRKRKLYVPLEGESHEEMLVRIARQQKKKMPFTSAPTGYNSSSPSKSARGDSRKRGTSSQAREKRSTRLGLRDWSEIVGMAALVGFPPEVIARTTQRCANLFGEGMAMLSLVENPPSGDEDRIVNFLPEEIPDLGKLDDHPIQSESEDGHPKIGRRPPRKRSRPRKRESEMNISESGQAKSSGIDAAYYCPYSECFRHVDGFAKKRYLSKHLRDLHKLDKQGVIEAEEDSLEEMEGGVHVDGFMKEIRRRAGWRAVDKERRRRKSGRSERVNSEDAEMMEVSEKSVNEWDESEDDMDEALDSD